MSGQEKQLAREVRKSGEVLSVSSGRALCLPIDERRMLGYLGADNHHELGFRCLLGRLEQVELVYPGAGDHDDREFPDLLGCLQHNPEYR